MKHAPDHGTLKKRVAEGVFAAATIVVPLVLDVRVAEAAEHLTAHRELDHRYRSTGGTTVTCHVTGSSELLREPGTPAFDGYSDTSVTGTGGCTAAAVSVTASYANPSGFERLSTADGQRFVDLLNNDIGTGYMATHRVRFSGCSADCEVSFQTTPK